MAPPYGIGRPDRRRCCCIDEEKNIIGKKYRGSKLENVSFKELEKKNHSGQEEKQDWSVKIEKLYDWNICYNLGINSTNI